jgi:phosphatidate cytidylyltransferase
VLLALALCVVVVPDIYWHWWIFQFDYRDSEPSPVDRATMDIFIRTGIDIYDDEFFGYMKGIEAFFIQPLSWLAMTFWLALVPCWLHYRWRVQGVVAAVVGLIVLAPFTIVIMGLAGRPWVLLGVLAMVWVADIAVCFIGRRWGWRKLAAGAMIAVMVGIFWVLAGMKIYVSWIPLTLMVCGGLAALSIMGNLFGALLKRQAGVEDSGRLLPGCGGIILGRIVSQAAPLSALLSSTGSIL